MFTFTQAQSNQDLDEVFRLRYQIYCLERGFEEGANHPDRRETDEFDAHSIHFLARDESGVAVGTSRLVKDSALGLPLESQWNISSALPGVPRSKCIEVSRMSVSKELKRPDAESAQGEISLGLMRACYWHAKKEDLTHWCAAVERPWWLVLRRLGFNFRQVGPPKEYHAVRIPCLTTLSELDETMQRWRPDIFAFMQHSGIDKAPAPV